MDIVSFSISISSQKESPCIPCSNLESSVESVIYSAGILGWELYYCQHLCKYKREKKLILLSKDLTRSLDLLRKRTLSLLLMIVITALDSVNCVVDGYSPQLADSSEYLFTMHVYIWHM